MAPRPAPARRPHHPPGHADLRHARARLRLDARRGEGRPRAPVARRRRSSTRTPASATTTCATTSSTCGSRSPSRRTPSSGLQGTLDVLQELTGAESIRQLPTLKLFKIRMDLEMEGDTKSLSTEGVAEAPVELEGVPYDELDIAVIRATQGDLPVVAEPYAPAAAELGMTVDALLDHMAGMKERGILRRVAAILYHRRAGFSANGMGVWVVPDEQDRRVRPADGRPSAASRTATSARPTRTGPTRSSRWPTAAPRRSATRSSTRSPTSSTSPSARRCTRRPSSRRSVFCTSPTTSRTGKREHGGV